jgi:hypothetical protein
MEELKTFKAGWWGRIKFLFSTFKIIYKSRMFYLAEIKDYQTKKDGTFEYKFYCVFNGITRESWDNFLWDHFNRMRTQSSLIDQFQKIANGEKLSG